MIREIVKRLQFSDDTTADGNRLDGLMQAVIDRFNKLLPRDVEREWTETTLVTGYQPSKEGATNPSPVVPWMNVLNSDANAPDKPSYFPTNKWRVRGTAIDGINPGTVGVQRCWSTSISATRPTILTGVSFTMRTDTSTTFANNFQYGATPPPGFSTGDSSRDFQLEIAVDNPFTPESRAQSNCEVQRVKFPATAWKMTSGAAVVATMKPLYPDGVEYPVGVFVNLDIRVPVPQNSRVRLRLIIPEYDATEYDTGWGDVAASTLSYSRQFYSASISMLEKA